MAQVLINCKWRTHERITGVQRYAHDLVEALAETDLDFAQISPAGGSSWKTLLWEQLVLPQRVRGYETLLCPANSAPIHLNSSVRLVITIHCLRFHLHPRSYSHSFVIWYEFMIPRLIARAQTVLTVSETMGNEIVDVYPHAAGKVEVVYPGVSRAFGIEGSSGDAEIGPEPYWVFVGNASSAKNLKIVLRAMAMTQHPHRLVLLGVDQAQLGTIGEPLPAERVIPLGHINNTDRVAAILRGATGLVAPSIYESFDLPTVEAMACGCPVVASDTPVHREIGRGASIYASPNDPVEWGHVMDHLHTDPLLRQHQRKLGLDRASHFSWASAAQNVVRILRDQGDPTSA